MPKRQLTGLSAANFGMMSEVRFGKNYFK